MMDSQVRIVNALVVFSNLGFFFFFPLVFFPFFNAESYLFVCFQS